MQGAAMRVLTGMLGLVLLAGGATARAEAPDIHAVVAERVAAAGAPGAAYVVIQDGKAEARAVGFASQAERIPMRTDMPLALGSVSKPFAAVAVLQLVDRGLVELDEPISRYLSWVRFADEKAADRITVRQLLTHTSGLSTYVGNLTQPDRSMEQDALRRRVETLTSVTPGPSGAAWAYSNANYQILGALVEEVSGLTYPHYVQRNIFDPLGMTRSFILVTPPGVEPATGHRRWFGILRPVTHRALGMGAAPQGGVYASAEDLGRFLGAFLSEDSPLLSEALRAEMLRPQTGVPKQGLGWRVSSSSRPGFIWHGGDSPGFAAFAGFDPNTRTGFGIMTNLGYNIIGAPTPGVTMGSASALFGLPPVPVRSSPTDIAMVAVLALVTVAALAQAVRIGTRRDRSRTRPRTRLGKLLSGLGAVFLIALAIVVLQVPRILFNASVPAAFVFMPDMIILLGACALSLALLGAMQLLFLGWGRAAGAVQTEAGR